MRKLQEKPLARLRGGMAGEGPGEEMFRCHKVQDTRREAVMLRTVPWWTEE